MSSISTVTLVDPEAEQAFCRWKQEHPAENRQLIAYCAGWEERRRRDSDPEFERAIVDAKPQGLILEEIALEVELADGEGLRADVYTVSAARSYPDCRVTRVCEDGIVVESADGERVLLPAAAGPVVHVRREG